jgi:hypothetical protein
MVVRVLLQSDFRENKNKKRNKKKTRNGPGPSPLVSAALGLRRPGRQIGIALYQCCWITYPRQATPANKSTNGHDVFHTIIFIYIHASIFLHPIPLKKSVGLIKKNQ